MNQLPKPLKILSERLKKLPGIGPKSAQRMMLHILNMPYFEVKELAKSILIAKKNIIFCSKCCCFTDIDPCNICSDKTRDSSLLCVVEQSIDIYTIESSRFFRGLYFVLGGSISPIDGLTPEKLHINELIKRVEEDKNLKEIIISTNFNLEGETTAMYLTRILKKYDNIAVTRLGKGLPIGASINYADDITLKSSFEGRKPL